MNSFIEYIQNNIAIFDLITFLIIFYSIVQSVKVGFIKSLFSFLKWLFALIITIILVPRLNHWTQNLIESKFVSDFLLGLLIYVLSFFIIIKIGKAISGVISLSGLGGLDKTIGLIFGIFKGYLICLCIFSLLNWFYPHKKWFVKTEGTYFFDIIYKGSNFMIKEFPKSKDLNQETEREIENI